MSFYNERFVNKGRTEKYCMCCGKAIKIGESSYTIPDVENDFSASHLCTTCYSILSKSGIDSEELFARYHDEDRGFDDLMENQILKEKIEELGFDK